MKVFSQFPSDVVAQFLEQYDTFKYTPIVEKVAIPRSNEHNIWYRGTSKFWFMAHYDKITDYDMTDPETLQYIEEGDRVIGNLDNGVGVSFLLDLFERFPQHNYVFTHEEEIGFDGARAMNKIIPLDAKVINLDISDDCQIDHTVPEPIVYLYDTREKLTEAFLKKGFRTSKPRGNDVFALDKKKEAISYHIQIKNMHHTNQEETTFSHLAESLHKLHGIVGELSIK